MMQLQISFSEKHYRFLQRQAQSQGTTLESLLSEIIDAEIAWQKALPLIQCVH